MLRLKWYHWTTIVVATLISLNAMTYPVEQNPFAELTVSFVLKHLVIGFVGSYLTMAVFVVGWRVSTSLLRRTYTFLHTSVENSAWINRVLYGPDWRDEINSTEN